MHSKIIFITILAATLGFGGGYYVASSGNIPGGFSGVSKENAQEIVTKLQKVGYLFEIGPLIGVTSITGIVKSVGSNQLKMVIQPSALDVILDNEDIRTILVDDQTEFIRQEALPPEEIQAEQERFNQALQENPSEFPILPSFTKEVSIALSDIAVGSQITIESNEEIGQQKEVQAARVITIESFLPPGSLPEGATP